MSDIITTLHPENDDNINLYPNIKRNNIPNKAIDRSRLDDSINSLLDSINELHPSGVDTSAHILAFTSNKGIYIGSDTGNWYYWNGSQYVSGGAYQATQIPDNSIDLYKMKYLFNGSNITLNIGDFENGSVDSDGINIDRSYRIRTKKYISITPNKEYTLILDNQYDPDLFTISVSFYSINDYTTFRISSSGVLNFTSNNIYNHKIKFTTPNNYLYKY